jgi:hypothetical protein
MATAIFSSKGTLFRMGWKSSPSEMPNFHRRSGFVGLFQHRGSKAALEIEQ